jgi:HlyD family secretion protein
MNKLKKRLFGLAIIVLLIIVAITVFSFFKNGNYETVEATRGDLMKITDITGKVVAAEEVDLSFGASGDVIKIYKDIGDKVKAGDLLAQLDSSEVQGEINEAQANLQSAESRLNEIEGSDSESEIAFKKDALLKTLNKAYVTSSSIVNSQADVFFENPDARNPNFSIVLGDYFERKAIDEKRYELGNMLEDWKESVETLSIDNISFDDGYTFVSNLNQVEDLLSTIASNSYNIKPTGSVTQSQIDSYIANINSGRTTVAGLIVDVNTSLDALRDVQAEIPVQNATIANNQATVSRLQSKASEYTLRAPFAGTITENNLEIGQQTSSSDVAFNLISDQPLEIEAFIPEINIIGIDIGDGVIVYFDAFGESKKFEAVVAHIDPKETIKDGLTTYRILVDLKEENQYLRPGMSSDLEIMKEIIPDQIIIPTYTLQSDGERDFVQIMLDGGRIEERDVQVGESDKRGNVSILSGVNVGDNLVIPK